MAIKILQYTFDSVNNPNGVKPTITPSSVQLTYEDSTVGRITTRIVYAETMPTKISFGNQPVLTLDYINVTEIQSLYGLFWDNTTIKKANISNQIAKNLTDIYGLFYKCSNIEKIDMSNLIIEKPITNSSSTFMGCGNLYELNLKGSKIDTDMYYTFAWCASLTEIDTSAFITDRATTFRQCFASCNRLKSIDISTWNTSNATNMETMFSGCSSLENITFGTNFKTSLVTNMSGMFTQCGKLKTINTLGFDTSKVTNMSNMFQNCTSLKILNLSSFNTSNVTTNGNMFNGLTSDLTIYRNSNTWTLTDTGGSPTFIDVNGKILGKYTFDNTVESDCLPTLTGGTISSEDSVSDNVTTRTIYLTGDTLPTKISFKSKSSLLTIDYLYINTNITDMKDMFQSCSNVTSINGSWWNTSNVTDMGYLFQACQKLSEVKGWNTWDTSKVTAMDAMFTQCYKITDVSGIKGWNVSNVLSFAYMFGSASGLTGELDLSRWRPIKSTNTQNMFVSTNLTSVNLSGWIVPNLTNMGSMFAGHLAYPLESVNMSNWVTEYPINMNSTFYNCPKLTTIDFTNSKIVCSNLSQTFQSCTVLTSLDLSSFNTSKVTNMNSMFQKCSSLTSLNLSSFDTSEVTSMSGMFNGCSSLTSLDLSSFNTSNVTNMLDMFSGCRCLKSIDLTNFDTTSLNIAQGMLSQCHALESVDLSSFNTANVTTIQGMFYNDSSLQSVDLSNFDSSNIKTTKEMFYNCNKLKQVGLLYSNASSINKIAENLYTSSNCDIYYYDADPSQLTPVNNITFIQYKFPNTISLPPHISLYALPDGTKDELDVKTGILTRNIGEIAITGQNINWVSNGFAINDGYTSLTLIADWGSPNYTTLCQNYGLPSNLTTTNNLSANATMSRTFNGGLNYWAVTEWGVGKIGVHIPIEIPTLDEAKQWLNENPIIIRYTTKTPTTEKLILNYNHSCEYGMVLPKGAVDYYDVVNSKYHKNIGSVYLQGDETWQSAEEYDKCVRFGIEFRGTGESNIKPGGGLYCDNDLFPNIDDDSDVEHCRYASDDSNILYFYVDKTRLMSPDLIGWQIWQQENPYTMYFELADTVTLDKPYEELDPNLARWEMMDSVKEGTISYTSNNDDGLTLYPNMTYVAPSVNNFDVEMLEPNTMYTVYADNVEGSLDLGGNTSDFVSGSTFTSGEDKWVTFNMSPDVENIMLIKGDTTDEVVPYFKGTESVRVPSVTTTKDNKMNILSTSSDVILRSNGDVKDEYNAKTGELIQRISESGEVLSQEVIRQIDFNIEYKESDKKYLVGVFDKTTNINISSDGLPPIVDIAYFTNEDALATITTDRATVTDAKADTYIQRAILYGNTLLNNVDLSNSTLSDNNTITEDGYVTSYANGAWSNAFIGQRQMEASTKYLCAIFVYENTLNDGIFGYMSEYQDSSAFVIEENIDYTFKARETGAKIFTMTTKTSINDSQYSFRAFLNAESTSGYVKFRVVAIKYEDYMENWNIDYFKDFGSVKMPVLTTTGKNLFDKEAFYNDWKSKVESYVYKEIVDNEEVLKVNNFYHLFADNKGFRINVEKGVPLTLRMECKKAGTESTNAVFIIRYGDNIYKSFPICHSDEWQTATTTFVPTRDYITICSGYNNDGYYYVKNIQLEENSTSTSYEPFKSNILTVNEDVTLRGIGDVRDELDLLTGKVTERIGEIVLDGSESWILTSDENDLTIRFALSLPLSKPTNIICEQFKVEQTYGKEYECIQLTDNKTLVVRISKEKATTLEMLKQWLSQNPITVQYELATPTVKTVDLTLTKQGCDELQIKQLPAYENGQILLSSESGLIPTLTYSVPSTNTFHLPSMKTGTRYTLKYPSASGNITIGNIKYNINSPSMLFTTPLTIIGDTSAIIFSDENPQDVMLIEGAYNTREIPLFTGVKSVVNPTINIIDNGTEESRTYRCQEEVELRSLPNGVADKLDIVNGKLTRAVGIRPYQDGDQDIPNTLTDGYNTIYQLSKPTVSSVTFVTPVVTSDSIMHLSSEALIPQLNYRVPSNNNFPLDLLEPNKTYTLYANTLVSGSYTLGGTHNGYFTGTEVIALGDVTNNLLTFDGDLGLSDVVLIKGNSINSELPYFEGLKTVENATITIAGIQGEENSITLDDNITLRACGDIKDTIDMVNLVMTQNLSEITLKGTEPWSLITTNESINDEYVLFGLVIGGIKSSVTTSLVCDKFNHKYQSGEMHNQEGIYAVNNQLRICVKKTTIGGETVDAIKTWLGQNNTRVIYALINPIEYQLQNSWTSTPPTSYNNRTTISSQVVDSLKPMISVTIATTTLEEIVSNLETRNTQLEEENLATMLALTSVYETMVAPSVATTETQVATYGGMSVSPMGMVYARLVSKGFKSIDEVPYNLQAEVMYALRGME